MAKPQELIINGTNPTQPGAVAKTVRKKTTKAQFDKAHAQALALHVVWLADKEQADLEASRKLEIIGIWNRNVEKKYARHPNAKGERPLVSEKLRFGNAGTKGEVIDRLRDEGKTKAEADDVSARYLENTKERRINDALAAFAEITIGRGMIPDHATIRRGTASLNFTAVPKSKRTKLNNAISQKLGSAVAKSKRATKSLAKKGWANKDIAETLGISLQNVRTFLK